MKRMDMKTVRLMDVTAKDIAHVAPLLPDIEFLMPDYGIDGDFTYPALTYSLPDGQAIFRAATNGSGPENLAKQIRSKAGTNRPPLSTPSSGTGAPRSGSEEDAGYPGPDVRRRHAVAAECAV